jgi:hypothetical protein
MRHQCETQPDKVDALLEQLDHETAIAIGLVLAGERKPQIKHVIRPR